MDQIIAEILAGAPHKLVLSKPREKGADVKRAVITRKKDAFHIERFTQTQAFHENVDASALSSRLIESLSREFMQLNAWNDACEFMVMVSKKGKVSFKKNAAAVAVKHDEAHNRQKRYIISEGTQVPPLVDMGVFTKDGKVVSAMQNKFRQINRFVELVDDAVRGFEGDHLNIVDFGCGKSYLTFVLYYYFTEIKKMPITMTGLDLKADVIEKCSAAARRYGYDDLHFEVGDIAGYESDKPVDMVLSLHACDTATDYALKSAIEWNAKLIFSVPCCQHEVNAQMKDAGLLARHGIVKERFSALLTDAIRANILTACGYNAQILEFIDMAHTPKNLLIRATKQNISKEKRTRAMEEVEAAMRAYGIEQALYKLLCARE